MTATGRTPWQQQDAERCLPHSLLLQMNVGAVVRSGSPGLSDVEWHFGRAALKEDSLFELGSLTKLFTAALLLRMVQCGEVALEDKISRYLPGGVASDSNVTLLDLATHHSGLPRLPSNIAYSPDPYAAYTATDLLEWMKQDGMRSSSVSPFLYSNLGYAVLGLVLEEATGKTYPELLQKYVLEPCCMTHTRLALNKVVSRECLQGHSKAGMEVPYWTHLAFAPCGGLVGTAKDMGRFLSHIYASQEYAQAFKPLAKAGTGQIGLGWLLQQNKRRAWHNGGTAGFSSYASIDIETGHWLIVLANCFTPEITNIGVALEKLYFDSEKP